MTHRSVLGIDVGGTSIKARLSTTAWHTIHEWRRPTPTGDTTGVVTARVIADMVREARATGDVDAIAVVVPGIVDETTGICINAVNLGWRDIPIREILEEEIGSRIAFDQDVRAGALGEVSTGAAADTLKTVVFVPIGTGIASAVVVKGRVLGSTEWAGEIGQVILSTGPHAGRRVESVASASAIARALRAPSAKEAARRVMLGDLQARSVWDDAVEVLADALGWLVATVGPDLIVVGGGLAEAGALLFEPLSARLADRVGVISRPTLVAAHHGEAAARVGACQLAIRALEAGLL